MNKQSSDKNGKPHKKLIKENILTSLKKVDTLFFVFFAITTLMLILAQQQASEEFSGLLYSRLTIFIAVGVIIYLNVIREQPFLGLIRNTYPIILSGYFYSETVYYNKSIFNNIDPLLENIELYIFGMQPSVTFAAYFTNPLFSELMYFGYFSFYLLILGFTFYVYFKQKEYFYKAVFLLSSSLYIFYFSFCSDSFRGSSILLFFTRKYTAQRIFF